MLGARQISWGLHGIWIVRRFIVSHAGGSPAKLGKTRCSDSSYKRHQLSWGIPWWSDLATSRRCAIKLLHAVWIRVLILGSTFGVLTRACQTTSVSFQTSFSLTLLQDSFFNFQQARGLSGHTSSCGECACSHLEATPGDWLPAQLVFYFYDPGTT